MADQNKRVPDDDQNKVVEDGSAKGGSLENFVTEHYEKQKNAGKMDGCEELTDERTNQFFSKAIAESRRMNKEVNKSNAKLDSLHSEFGLEMVNAWQDEHATEVLSAHQHELVKQAQYQGDT